MRIVAAGPSCSGRVQVLLATRPCRASCAAPALRRLLPEAGVMSAMPGVATEPEERQAEAEQRKAACERTATVAVGVPTEARE